MNQVILSDDLITLKPFLLEYAEAQLAGEDEESVKWLSEKESTLESVKNWIIRNQKSWENDGPIFNFAIFNEENKLVGMVEANSDTAVNPGMAEGDINISYAIYPKFRGKGYATRAVDLMVDFLKTKKRFHYAIIRVDEKNVHSLEVPARAGFGEFKRHTDDNEKTEIWFRKEI